MIKRKIILTLAAILVAAAGAHSEALPKKAAREPAPGLQKIDVELVAEAVEAIKARYVDEPDGKKMVRDAISGMVSGLDPFSVYLTPELLAEEEGYIDGSYVGIGVEVALREGRLEVVTPIEGGPAKRNGIASGDIIEEVNGDPVQEISYDAAVEKLRGPEGTRVTLGIRRGEADLRDVTLTREKIKLKSVYTASADGVEVIRLTSFQRTTVDEFTTAMKEIRKKNPKGVVLDMRDNPGGLIDQAAKVADLFLKSGKIVYTRGRDERENALYLARDDKSEPAWPLAVLVNRGTASAAEILAGALKDRKRGLVVGEKTFGKGSVQSVIDLSDGSAIRLTTALYYTPSGVSIHRNGIPSDVEVAAPPGELSPGNGEVPPDPAKDTQLIAAVSLINEGRCPTAEEADK